MNPPNQTSNSSVFPAMDSFPQADTADTSILTPPRVQVVPDPSLGNIVTTDTFSAPPVSTPPSQGNLPVKKIAAGFGVFVLLAGVVAGLLINRNSQVNNASAWDCSKYTFNISSSGSVTVQNGSSRNEPQQRARVSINGNVVETFTVPALNPGQGATLGTISVPSNQAYTWSVVGTSDCENSGSSGSASSSAKCLNILAYDSTWKKLTATQLSALKSGADVIFSVSGTATSGSIDKARFSINGASPQETTTKKPSTEEYYVEYKIPASVTSFTIEAQLHHSEAGWF